MTKETTLAPFNLAHQVCVSALSLTLSFHLKHTKSRT